MCGLTIVFVVCNVLLLIVAVTTVCSHLNWIGYAVGVIAAFAVCMYVVSYTLWIVCCGQADDIKKQCKDRIRVRYCTPGVSTVVTTAYAVAATVATWAIDAHVTCEGESCKVSCDALATTRVTVMIILAVVCFAPCVLAICSPQLQG